MSHKKTLIIFTKYPEPGKTKTRLIPAVGSKGAAELHRRMAENTVSKALSIQDTEDILIKIFFEGGNIQSMRDWLGKMDFERQKDGDLGEKMSDAFEKGFSGKAPKVVIIGTDCPNLTASLLLKAFAILDKHDLVVGPAVDGGYYLIGLKKRAGFLFQGISWGSENVFRQTSRKAEEYGLKKAVLETLGDVDRPGDLFMFDPQK
jgi:hypothetical protein